MNSSMIQRQLKLNAGVLSAFYKIYESQREGRKHFVKQSNWAAVKTFTSVIDKNRKKLAAMEQLQKSLKRALKEAYWQEHFAKTYEPLPDDEDDFLWLEATRVAAEEGFVGPTVVLEIEGMR